MFSQNYLTPKINLPKITLDKRNVVINVNNYTHVNNSPCIANCSSRTSVLPIQLTPVVLRIDSSNVPNMLRRRINFDTPESVSKKRKLDDNFTFDIISQVAKKPRNSCRCGSFEHQRTTHRDCPLNKKFSDVTVFPEAEVIDDSIQVRACKCGSYDHFQTNHKNCPLNEGKCKCGSTEHRTTRHAMCSLNKSRHVVDLGVEENITSIVTNSRNPMIIQAREILSSNVIDNLQLPNMRISVYPIFLSIHSLVSRINFFFAAKCYES